MSSSVTVVSLAERCRLQGAASLPLAGGSSWRADVSTFSAGTLKGSGRQHRRHHNMTRTRRRGQRLAVKPALVQVHNQVRDAQRLHCSNILSFHLGTWGSLESKPGFGVPPWTVAPHPQVHGAGGAQLFSERAPVASPPWTSASKSWTGLKSRDSTRAFHRTERHFLHRCVHSSSDGTGGADRCVSRADTAPLWTLVLLCAFSSPS